jgi:hypothetical protein
MPNLTKLLLLCDVHGSFLGTWTGSLETDAGAYSKATEHVGQGWLVASTQQSVRANMKSLEVLVATNRDTRFLLLRGSKSAAFE